MTPPGRTQTRVFQMRVDDDFITQIDNWRRLQPDFPNRSQAVRRLTALALEADNPTQAIRRLTALALEAEAAKKGRRK